MGFSCGSTGSEERTEEIIYMIYSHWSSTNNMHWQCCLKRQDNWTVFSSWLVFYSKFCYLQKFFPLIKSICTSRVAQMVKCLSTMWETRVWSLGREDPLEKENFRVSPQHLRISEKIKLLNCDEQVNCKVQCQNDHRISGENQAMGRK